MTFVKNPQHFWIFKCFTHKSKRKTICFCSTNSVLWNQGPCLAAMEKRLSFFVTKRSHYHILKPFAVSQDCVYAFRPPLHTSLKRSLGLLWDDYLSKVFKPCFFLIIFIALSYFIRSAPMETVPSLWATRWLGHSRTAFVLHLS